MQSDASSDDKEINPVDLVLMLVVVSFAATLILLDRYALPAYTKLYRDFGTKLPLVTRAVLSHVAPFGTATLAVLVGASSFVARRQGASRMALGLSLAGIGIGIAGVVFCFYALYAPIFELAGKINP